MFVYFSSFFFFLSLLFLLLLLTTMLSVVVVALLFIRFIFRLPFLFIYASLRSFFISHFSRNNDNMTYKYGIHRLRFFHLFCLFAVCFFLYEESTLCAFLFVFWIGVAMLLRCIGHDQVIRFPCLLISLAFVVLFFVVKFSVLKICCWCQHKKGSPSSGHINAIFKRKKIKIFICRSSTNF